MSPPEEVIPWGIEWMGAPAQWDTNTGKSIKVAIIDTGIDLNHQDLKVNIKGGFNAFQKKKAPNDISGHGTHLAGIVAAARNGVGVVGVAPDAELYAVDSSEATNDEIYTNINQGFTKPTKEQIKEEQEKFKKAEKYVKEKREKLKKAKGDIEIAAAGGVKVNAVGTFKAGYRDTANSTQARGIVW